MLLLNSIIPQVSNKQSTYKEISTYNIRITQINEHGRKIT